LEFRRVLFRSHRRACQAACPIRRRRGLPRGSARRVVIPMSKANRRRVGIYARYSSDLQSDTSIEDQRRLCSDRARSKDWEVVEHYGDAGLSGASLVRPGIQALIADALAGKFDIVLAEALDRLSRDQEDIAGVYKRMEFAGVKIVTLSEGEVSSLHIGLK